MTAPNRYHNEPPAAERIPFELEYDRPHLYPKQLAAVYDQHRFSLIEASTKSGKTSGCIAWLVEQALDGRDGWNYWWVAPVSDQALIAFRRMMRSLPSEMFTANISLKTITLVNGAVIWFKSGDKPNSLYGEDVYAAVLDEASRMKEDAYIAIRTTLTATRGPIRIIGNVRGRKNWFFRMARKAEREQLLGTGGEMGYHKIVAADAVAAGVLAQKEIDDAKEQLPEQWFRELYFAEASDDGGNPFGMQHIEACVRPELLPGTGVVSNKPPRAWGWDFAKKRDYCVGIAIDEDGAICRFERFHHVPWGEVMNKVASLCGQTPALGDSTGVGDVVVETIQRMISGKGAEEHCPFQGYLFTPASKQKLMEGLAVAIQSRTLWYPDNVVRQEMEQFEFELTRTGVRYCMDSETPVLTSDLRYVPVGSLKAGDSIAAFDENPVPGLKVRKWRTAYVTDTGIVRRPCYRVRLVDGTEFVCSAEHQWLTASNMGAMRWLQTKELRGARQPKSRRFAPHRLIRVVDHWGEASSYDTGYLAAAFDGEGSLSQQERIGRSGSVFRLSFAQRENGMLSEVRRILAKHGFRWSENAGNGSNEDVTGLGILGGQPEVLRLLGQIRPKRLLAKFDPDRIGALWTNSQTEIESIEDIGEHDVVALGTTSKTFVASGYATHNSAPEGYFDDCVCALALANMCRAMMPAAIPTITAAMLAQIAAAGRRR